LARIFGALFVFMAALRMMGLQTATSSTAP